MSDWHLGKVSCEERRHLYWASNGWAFPITENQIIQPRRWVADSALFAELSRDASPSGIAAVRSRLDEFDATPTLEKCVAELVYEQVREGTLPLAPSRLNCLFVARDAASAVQFAAAYIPMVIYPSRDTNLAALAVSTADRAWVELDMYLFATMSLAGRDEPQIAKTLEALTAQADRYWTGEQSSSPFPEILAEKLWRWTAFIGDEGPPPDYATWLTSRRTT